MKFLYVLVAVLATVAGQYQDIEPEIYRTYPEWYAGQRQPRDVTLDHKTDNGRLFGTLGQNNNGVFGKGGYEYKFFDDHRGTLNGQVHGTRVLGPYEDSSHIGGGLNWKNSYGTASVDVDKMINGPTSYQVAAGRRWPLGKNGDFSLQGTYGQTSGMRPEYGAMAVLKYQW